MQIVVVSAEAAPFAKTGGLADAVWVLCKAFTSAGHTVRLVVPMYRPADENDGEPRFTGTIPGMVRLHYSIYERIKERIIINLVGSPDAYHRSGVYGDTPAIEYPDNALRFAVLNHAAVAVCRAVAADIIHVHDWPASLVPAIVKKSRENIPTVLTIHNASFLGRFSKHDIHLTGLEPVDFMYNGKSIKGGETIDFLAAGVSHADKLTTVSQTYAKELVGGEHGDEIKSLLEGRRISGILNGVDYDTWDPNSDRLLPQRYDPADMRGKSMCKRQLQVRFGLATENRIPIIGMVSRLTEQKGLLELCESRNGAFSRICGLSAQVVVVGTGEPRFETALREYAKRFENFAVHVGYDEELEHLVEAGSDLYLMPSRFEPCGSNQLYSLKYGTPPIVHSTGGLADTVDNWNDRSGVGTGFVYDDQSCKSVFRAARRAIDCYTHSPDQFNRIRANGMALDFSRKTSAEKYLELFRGLRMETAV